MIAHARIVGYFRSNLSKKLYECIDRRSYIPILVKIGPNVTVYRCRTPDGHRISVASNSTGCYLLSN